MDHPVEGKTPRGAIAVACLVSLAATVAAVSAGSLRGSERQAARAPAPSASTHPGASACRDRSGDESWGSDEEGGRFTLQQSLGGGRRLCARVEGTARFDANDGEIRELAPGSSVLIETRDARSSQRMLVSGAADGPRYDWSVNGVARTPDDAARAWLADALRVVAGSRELGRLQGRVGALQGEIGKVQGELGSLQGEIGSVQGTLGGLQGRVGSLQGEQGSLQGAIGSHQGAIGGLQAARDQASAELRARIEAEIELHRAAIRKLQSELDGGELARRLAGAQAELRRAEAASRDQIGELERKIEAVKADERIGELERRIHELHADERMREIETQLKPALERLNAAAARLGS